MRIPCPYCGSRDTGEFVYRGDADPSRPETSETTAFVNYVYMRDNIAGPINEHWYHVHGCRQWLVVRRDTVTHEIISAISAREAAR